MRAFVRALLLRAKPASVVFIHDGLLISPEPSSADIDACLHEASLALGFSLLLCFVHGLPTLFMIVVSASAGRLIVLRFKTPLRPSCPPCAPSPSRTPKADSHPFPFTPPQKLTRTPSPSHALIENICFRASLCAPPSPRSRLAKQGILHTCNLHRFPGECESGAQNRAKRAPVRNSHRCPPENAGGPARPTKKIWPRKKGMASWARQRQQITERGRRRPAPRPWPLRECGSRPRELPAGACAAEAEGWGPH